MKPPKGTTNLGFVYKGGIMLASDSRTTYVDKEKQILISDEEQKLVPLNSESTIVCTIAGVISYWYLMYHAVNNSAPESAEKASLRAYKYMTREMDHDDLEDYKDRWGRTCVDVRNPNCGKVQDFQLYRVNLDAENNACRGMMNVDAIGSGAKYAMIIFGASLVHHGVGAYANASYLLIVRASHTYESYGKHKNLTREQAIELATKAVFYATLADKFSGGYIKVYYMNENGCKEVRSRKPLDVYYEYYNLYGIDQCTLFLLYSTKFKPYFAEDNLKDLINAIWPTGEIEHKHFSACHLVAKKRDFYFHRLVLDLEEDVPYAYDLIKKQAPLRDNGVLGGKFLACKLGLEREIEAGGTEHVTVYLEKSSKDLLQLLCKLEDPDNLVYN